jgi:hypothetical protein
MPSVKEDAMELIDDLIAGDKGYFSRTASQGMVVVAERVRPRGWLARIKGYNRGADARNPSTPDRSRRKIA